MVRYINNGTIALGAGTLGIISEEKTSGRRVAIEINNTNAAGGNDVWVSVGQEAAANTGRRIQPGQSIVWSTDGGYIPPQTRITGYCVGAATLAVYEEIEV